MYVPAEYPNIPPLVHFRSFLNEKLNPNLYVDGSICLSLLGSWHGEGVELWSSSKSNLLQVLFYYIFIIINCNNINEFEKVMLSIQGLILGTGDPYFLEAGYEKYKNTPSGTEKSARYNQLALTSTFRHIHHLITSLLIPSLPTNDVAIFYGLFFISFLIIKLISDFSSYHFRDYSNILSISIANHFTKNTKFP